jgi:hypothetical protein
MCLQTSAVKPWQGWNWSGDEIVHKPIIPASRTIPGTRRRYPIDIREFLTTTSNAVVSETLGTLIDDLPSAEQALFRSHARGSFDFRTDQVVRYVGRLGYRKSRRGPDAWLFPDETLAQGGGDCEDLSFLLAALLTASGISPYCVRVALGCIRLQPAGERPRKHDHCWVMYQNEQGLWEILEPLSLIDAGRPAARRRPLSADTAAAEYLPDFVFNADHLWRVRSARVAGDTRFDAYCEQRAFWQRFDPSFAAGVHATIFEQALGDLAPAGALAQMKRRSLWLDANLFGYDPRDHFDNGYVGEGWSRVAERLQQFHRDNADWASLGAAGHGIGDFYAHTSYLHFARLKKPAAAAGRAAVYCPNVPLVASPRYGPEPAAGELPVFDLTSNAFSVNGTYWKGRKAEVAEHWADRMVSGRYAQRDDAQSFFEGFTAIPRALLADPGFAVRGSLPHHDEIAVDGSVPGKRHRLYRSRSAGPADRGAYDNQFRWRRNTAVAHLRQAFLENWHG